MRAVRALWVALGLLGGAALAAPSDDGDDQALLADADYVAGRAAIKAGDDALALGRFQSALPRRCRRAQRTVAQYQAKR